MRKMYADPCGHAVERVVCGRLLAGIAGSIPAEGMDIRLLYVCRVVCR